MAIKKTAEAAGKTAMRPGVSYLNTLVYIFNSLHEPDNGRTASLHEALTLIEQSQYSERITKARKAGKGSNEYNQAKKNIPCFSWNVSSYQDDYRKSSNALHLSGLMYFDRDTAGDIQELSVLPELVCAWRSFGGLGDGFLVAVDGLTVHNFKSTWKALQARFLALGLVVDTSCSNIDRANVLSCSNVLFADQVTPFQAVEPETITQPERTVSAPLQDPDQTYTNLKKWLDREGEYYQDGNRNQYIVRLAAACNRFGIPVDDAVAWMVQDLEYAATHVPGEEISKKVRAIYKAQAASFATQVFDNATFGGHSQKKRAKAKKGGLCAPVPVFGAESILTFSSVSLYKRGAKSEYKKPIQERLLTPGQYLSDLKLDFSQSQYIDAPPAIGKTAAIIRSGVSCDLLVPTQDQAKQLGHEYGMDYVSEGRKPTDSEQQAGTYNALNKFVRRDTSGRTLVIDEAHNLALSQGFRSAVLNNMLDQAGKYKNVVLLSGTPIKSCHPLLRNTPITRVRRQEPQEKAWQVVLYQNRETSLIKRLERGKLQTVVLQDKDRGQQLADLLRNRGFNVQCFNASTKEEEAHREIIERCNVSEGVEVLIVTGLFFEGLNIYNINVGSVHLLSELSRYHMAQLYDRFRKQKPATMIQYRSAGANLYQDVVFDWEEEQAQLLESARNQVKAIQGVYGKPDTEAGQVAEDILKSLQGDFRHLTRFTDSWQVNYLGVDYLTVQRETRAMHRDLNLMDQLLSEYGFKLTGVAEDSETEEQLKEQAKEIAEASKAARLRRMADVLQTFEYGGMSYVIRAAESKNEEEAETANRVLELEKYIPFLQAINLLREPLSDSKYKLLRDQVRFQRYLQLRSKTDVSTPETRMLDTIANLFQPGETVTADQIRDRLQKIRSKHFRTEHNVYTPQTAVRVLKQFFEVERTTRYNNGKENCYRIVSSNPLGIALENEARMAA